MNISTIHQITRFLFWQTQTCLFIGGQQTQKENRLNMMQRVLKGKKTTTACNIQVLRYIC